MFMNNLVRKIDNYSFALLQGQFGNRSVTLMTLIFYPHKTYGPCLIRHICEFCCGKAVSALIFFLGPRQLFQARKTRTKRSTVAGIGAVTWRQAEPPMKRRNPRNTDSAITAIGFKRDKQKTTRRFDLPRDIA